MAKKKLFSGIVLFAIGVALIGGLLVKIDSTQLVDLLLNFSPKAFLAILGLTLAANLIANLRGWMILRSRGIKVPFWKLFSIWLSGNAFNYTTPFVYIGGEGIKAYLLNEKHDVSWRRATSFLIFDRMLEITAAFVIIIGALITFVSISGLSGLTKTFLSGIMGVSVAAFLIFLIYFQIFRNKKIAEPVLRFLSAHNTRFGRFLRKAERDVIEFFDPQSRTMWYAWGLSALKQIIFLIRHIYLIYFLTGDFHFIASAIALGMLYLGFVFPIPASLGVQEALQGVSLALFGFTAGQGFALSFILRGADITFVIVGIAFVLKYGLSLIAGSAKRVLQFNNNNGSDESDDE